MKERVKNEVELHIQLKHPSILELYDYFEDDRYVYLVMELCQNGELYRYLVNKKANSQISSPRSVASGNFGSSLEKLSEPQVRGVMKQVIDGVIYLHSQGIIHRDLKLSNLLLNDKNQIVSV